MAENMIGDGPAVKADSSDMTERSIAAGVCSDACAHFKSMTDDQVASAIREALTVGPWPPSLRRIFAIVCLESLPTSMLREALLETASRHDLYQRAKEMNAEDKVR